MSSSTHEMLVELPRERWGALSRLVPDSPWTTSALHAIQNRKASVLTDSPADPQTLVVLVRAPESDKRADLYMPHGFNHSLPDHADVSLLR